MNVANKSDKHYIFSRIILIIFFITIIYYIKSLSSIKAKNYINFDQYETNVYNNIKNKLINSGCSIMNKNQREFINGLIRYFKPKKILELGVFFGGSSIIILNAIKDIEDSHLFSIDINNSSSVGKCVDKYFKHLSNKWTLFKGGIAAEFLETIGNDIDFAMIDTAHFEPGEILDFLLVLPFLKEEAIVIFHDIDHQITFSKGKNLRNEWAPYIIFNNARGEKFLPSGKGIFNKDIGAVKLEKNQKKYYHDYCRALGSQWQYFPLENHIRIILDFVKKYYDNECFLILKEAINFNRHFVLDNPKKIFNYSHYKIIKQNYD